MIDLNCSAVVFKLLYDSRTSLMTCAEAASYSWQAVNKQLIFDYTFN